MQPSTSYFVPENDVFLGAMDYGPNGDPIGYVMPPGSANVSFQPVSGLVLPEAPYGSRQNLQAVNSEYSYTFVDEVNHSCGYLASNSKRSNAT